MVNYFVNSFASVFNVNVPVNFYQIQICANDISPLVLTPDMVENSINGLDANSSMGGDGIHPKFLKSLANKLFFPLCIIFNNSLNCGQLPNSWKRSIVVSIYKKGTKPNLLNYRPVSLASVSCKILERLLVTHSGSPYDLHLYVLIPYWMVRPSVIL